MINEKKLSNPTIKLTTFNIDDNDSEKNTEFNNSFDCEHENLVTFIKDCMF